MKRGLFIVLEGIDGSGTTTQTNLLYYYIKNLPNHQNIIQTHEPWENKEIQRMLKKDKNPYSNAEKITELYINNRENHQRELIKPSLGIGGIVLCDRYHLSTFAYQGVQGISVNEIKRMHNTKEIINPDLTLFLDINLKTAKKRISKREKQLEKFERKKRFTKKLIKKYNNLVDIAQENENFLGRIIRINGNQSVMKVAKDIQKEFNSLYDS